jgi:hypothetical protein
MASACTIQVETLPKSRTAQRVTAATTAAAAIATEMRPVPLTRTYTTASTVTETRPFSRPLMPTLFPIATSCLRLRRTCHCHPANRHPSRRRRQPHPRSYHHRRHHSLHHHGYPMFRLSPRPCNQSKPKPRPDASASPGVRAAKKDQRREFRQCCELC